MQGMSDRRSASRFPIEIFFNKYLDGHPYLCRSVDLSTRGMLATTFVEPAGRAESFSLELRLPGASASVWVWAREAGRRGKRQALEFAAMHPSDEARIEQFLISLDEARPQ